MKKTGTIFDIKKFAVHDGPGIRTTVFFKGCPLHCLWCHNPESFCAEPQQMLSNNKIGSQKFENKITLGREISADQLLIEILKDEVFYKTSGGGVTFSGGEPLAQIDFLENLLSKCKNKNIHTTVDTSGFVNISKLKQVINLVDLWLYDLKLFDNGLHKKFTSVENNLILSNLEFLLNNKENVNIRIPLITEITDTESNLDLILSYLKKIGFDQKINLLPYHNSAASKYKKLDLKNPVKTLIKQTPVKLKQIERRFTDAGFSAKLGG